MYLPRPKSFLKLILTGFFFVALPLLIALGFAGWYVDRMANQSQHAVYQGARATQSSRILVEQVTVMERAARQYQVLKDKALLVAYSEARNKFHETIENLLTLALDDKFRTQLEELNIQEQILFSEIQFNTVGSPAGKQAMDQFVDMSSRAKEVLSGSHRIIDREVQVMYDLASSAQQLFVWFGLALIPAIILIVFGFSFLIAKPIRQINRAILGLGEGEFTRPIKVAGPKDLEFLGERLNWLRMRLADVEHEKLKFLRHVSHELKTPLTAIREGTNLLADGLVGKLKPEQYEVVQILGTNSNQLQHLIEDLLNFSVAHLHKPKIKEERVNFDQLIEKVIADQTLAIMAKQLKVNVQTKSITIYGDKEKLRIVLDNLLSNAVKYSPQEGVIDIEVARNGDHILVEISDLGPGISAWEKERVFEAFYQGEAVAGGHIKGTGLGLSIARDYVLAHGGSISVGNKNSVKGAHFSMRLPLGLAREAS